MGCSEGLARIFLFVSNFAFVLVGLALLVVGILYRVSLTKLTDAIPAEYSQVQYVPTIAIVIGVIIFVIAFLGCCGALKSNSCMLSWFGGILIAILIAQVALGIYGFVQIKDQNDLENRMSAQIEKLFGQYSSNREVVDLIQQTFRCCGTTGPSSWGQSIPESCYENGGAQLFQEGCSTRVPQYLVGAIKLVAIVAIVISLVEVIGALLAFCVAGCIRERKAQHY